jgi:hypothetical protein
MILSKRGGRFSKVCAIRRNLTKRATRRRAPGRVWNSFTNPHVPVVERP